MMDKNDKHALLMDYLYGEIDEDRRKELEQQIKDDPDLHRELEELQQTRMMMLKIPMREPARKRLTVRTEEQGFNRWLQDVRRVFLPHSTAGRTAIAIAALFLMTFFLASVAKLQVSAHENGWAVTFGSEPPVIQQGVDTEMLDEIIVLLRQENLALASTIMEENRQQNEIYQQETVDEILRYMEQQRRNDLQLVARELAQMEEDSYYRYLQTNETIGELLYVIQQE